MTTQEALKAKLVFRYYPLLDMALSLLVLGNPESFGSDLPWVGRVTERLSDRALAAALAEAQQSDLFSLAFELEERRSAAPAPERPGGLGTPPPTESPGLADYWAAVAPEIAAGSGLLAESVRAEPERLATMEVGAFLGRFSDRISVAGDGESIVLHWGKGLRVPVADLERIIFVPSVFCPRRIMFYRLGSVQLFFYPVEQPVPAADAPVPESLTLGFTALADGTRLRLLRLVARESLPAQEMARRLGVNESTVSRHLRLLTEAGLVFRQRQEGKLIYYGVQPGRLDQLVAGIKSYVLRRDEDLSKGV